jgi:hypothetical protein
LHRRDHRVRLGQRSGKRLLHDDVRAVRGDLFHPLAMLRGSGTKDDDVRLRLLHAGPVVREHLLLRRTKVPCRIHKTLRLLIADAHDLGVGMLRGLPQQVAHVKVIEIDARDAPFFAHKWHRSRSAGG